jgi:hypothetical protein
VVVNCASEKSDGTMLSAAARVDDVAIALELFRSAESRRRTEPGAVSISSGEILDLARGAPRPRVGGRALA